jgi:hypothetical protein
MPNVRCPPRMRWLQCEAAGHLSVTDPSLAAACCTSPAREEFKNSAGARLLGERPEEAMIIYVHDESQNLAM